MRSIEIFWNPFAAKIQSDKPSAINDGFYHTYWDINHDEITWVFLKEKLPLVREEFPRDNIF